MDIVALLKLLDKDIRNLVIAFVLAFPVAYFDCWCLNLSFRALELFPQIIIAAGIGMLFVAFGFAMSGLILMANPQLSRNTLILYLITFYGTSCIFIARKLIGFNPGINDFFLIYLRFTGLAVLLFPIMGYLFKEDKGADKKQDSVKELKDSVIDENENE